jgi:hypothetical protein
MNVFLAVRYITFGMPPLFPLSCDRAYFTRVASSPYSIRWPYGELCSAQRRVYVKWRHVHEFSCVYLHSIAQLLNITASAAMERLEVYLIVLSLLSILFIFSV